MVQSLWVKNMEVLLCHFCGRCCFRSWGSQLLMSSHLSLDSCRLLLGWESVNLSHCQTKCSPAQAQSRERKWLPWCGGIKPMEIDRWWQVRTWAPDYCPMTGHLFRPCTNGRSASATGLPMIWKKSNKLGLKLEQAWFETVGHWSRLHVQRPEWSKPHSSFLCTFCDRT